MSVHKRGNGWQVRWMEGTRHRSRQFDRRTDAETYDRELRRYRQLGQIAPPVDGGMTLEDLIVEWLAFKRGEVRSVTYRSYRDLLQTHVTPHLGHIPIGQLSPRRLVEWRAQRLEKGAGRVALGKAISYLKSALDHAEAMELIQRNPARVLKQPKREPRKRTPPATPAQIEAMRGWMSERERPGDAALLSVLGYLGLRPGEALALMWSDVGPDTLLVERAVSMGAGEIGPTKTGNSRRVTLTKHVKTDLASWRLLSSSAGYLFPNAKRGGPWNKVDWDNWREDFFNKARDEAGLPKGFSPYKLRHSAASFLIAKGMVVTDVAAELGHSPEECLRTYAHAFSDPPQGNPDEWIAEARRAA